MLKSLCFLLKHANCTRHMSYKYICVCMYIFVIKPFLDNWWYAGTSNTMTFNVFHPSYTSLILYTVHVHEACQASKDNEFVKIWHMITDSIWTLSSQASKDKEPYWGQFDFVKIGYMQTDRIWKLAFYAYNPNGQYVRQFEFVKIGHVIMDSI